MLVEKEDDETEQVSESWYQKNIGAVSSAGSCRVVFCLGIGYVY
jgi:hypothetical protein